MNTPTEKQISFAKQIAEVLRIELPCDYTKQAYWSFINKHIDEYNQAKDCCYDDEEYLNWICAYDNDVWCEHY